MMFASAIRGDVIGHGKYELRCDADGKTGVAIKIPFDRLEKILAKPYQETKEDNQRIAEYLVFKEGAPERLLYYWNIEVSEISWATYDPMLQWSREQVKELRREVRAPRRKSRSASPGV